MKPLELTWYPLDRSYPTGYRLPRDVRITVRGATARAERKRLTDAELAAEVHFMGAELQAQYALHDFRCADTTRDRYWTLHRFATTDSHDQEET